MRIMVNSYLSFYPGSEHGFKAATFENFVKEELLPHLGL